MTDIVEVTDVDVVEVDVNNTVGQTIELFGQQGPAGPAGPQGPAGAAGADGAPGESALALTYEQGFASPTNVWVINHPLGIKPFVETFDQNDYEIYGEVQTPDLNTVIVTFFLPFAGTARLKG